MRSRRTFAIGCLAVAVSVAGCGGLADGSWSPEAIAVIEGTFGDPPATSVAGPSGTPDVSLALFWYSAYASELWFLGAEPTNGPYRHEECDDSLQPESCDGTLARGSEVCSWRDELPQPLVRATKYTGRWHMRLDFEVPVYELPPAVARYDLARQGGSGTFALGYLIAFDGEDGDGAFRYGTPRNAPEPTLAISAFQDYPPPPGHPRTSWFVAFLDGSIELGNVGASYEEVLRGLPKGFSLWRKEEWTDGYGRSLGIRRRAVPIDTHIDLFTLPAPDLTIGCIEGTQELRRLDDIPSEAPLWCSAQADRAIWNPEARGTGQPCTTLREEYRADYSCAPSPPPAWDCPSRGELRIVVSTSSWFGDTDPDGYDFVVRSASGATLFAGSLGADDEVTFEHVSPGEYVVELEGVALGCRTRPATVTIDAGWPAQVFLAVECNGTSWLAREAAGGAATAAHRP